jgi:hypothetical protein
MAGAEVMQKGVEAAVYVSMAGKYLQGVWAAVYVSMADRRVSTRSLEAAVYVSIAGRRVDKECRATVYVSM